MTRVIARTNMKSPKAWTWQKREEYGNKGQGTAAIDGAERTMWIFEPHVAEKVQAYCYPYCVTDHPDNRIPFPKPEGYDPAQYELLLRIFQAGWRETFDKFDPIPNRKTDSNNHGPFSTDNIGKYPSPLKAPAAGGTAVPRRPGRAQPSSARPARPAGS